MRVSKSAIQRRLQRKGGKDVSQTKKKRDMLKGNAKGHSGLRKS